MEQTNWRLFSFRVRNTQILFVQAMHLRFCIARGILEYDVGSACENAKPEGDIWKEQRLVLKILVMCRKWCAIC